MAWHHPDGRIEQHRFAGGHIDRAGADNTHADVHEVILYRHSADFELNMKKNKSKKNKNLWLNETEIEVGYFYFTMSNQYRAVLAMQGDFLIYAPSSEGMELLAPNTKMPFENSPFKKCQIATFAQKEYQVFGWNGTQAVRHKLTDTQLAEAIAQCNAKAAIDVLLAE